MSRRARGRRRQALLRWQHATRGLCCQPSSSRWRRRAADRGHLRMGARAGLPAGRRLARPRPPGSASRSTSPPASSTIPAWWRPPSARSRRAGQEPGTLVLEITATALMPYAGRTATILRELQQEGVRVAIEDVGTGYVSLAYLQRFPVTALKIYRTFVAASAREAAPGARADAGPARPQPRAGHGGRGEVGRRPARLSAGLGVAIAGRATCSPRRSRWPSRSLPRHLISGLFTRRPALRADRRGSRSGAHC